MNIVDVLNVPLHFKIRGSLRKMHPTTMPLWSMLHGIQDNHRLAQTTEEGRRVATEQGKEAFKTWKPRNLMAVYFAPVFKDPAGRPNTDNLSGYSGLAGFDFDGVDDVVSLTAVLKGMPHVVCGGVSASGKGVWCVARVAASTLAEYHACYAEGVAGFLSAGLESVDKGCFDPTRARFVAADPDCWWRWDTLGDIPPLLPVGDVGILRTSKKHKHVEMTLPLGYSMGPELACDEVRLILAEADDIEDGERNNFKAHQLGKIKALCRRHNLSPNPFAIMFIQYWDNAGSTHKKTVQMVERLLLKPDKETS